MANTVDYIVVGAGSAGCVLANRLSAAHSVLLLEAGPRDAYPWIHIPIGYAKTMFNPRVNWCFYTEPEPGMNGRKIYWPRGKTLGGSSSINGLISVRGQREDYDRWAAAGNAGWSYADALPYFRKQESWEGGASAYRGGDGPLTTRRSAYADPLFDAWLQAGMAVGHPFTDDYNGAEQHGFAQMQCTIRAGRRCSAADAYLRPALRHAWRPAVLATGGRSHSGDAHRQSVPAGRPNRLRRPQAPLDRRGPTECA